MSNPSRSQSPRSRAGRGHEMPNPPQPPGRRIRIGISSCVLGNEVRFNGGHKLSRFVRDELGPLAEFVAVCPEVEMGLSVPRETVRLVRAPDGDTRLRTSKSGVDYSRRMRDYAGRKVAELEQSDLSGFIVQKGSPSCGMERVKVYAPGQGMPDRSGRGLFTQELMRQLPLLPVEEDGRLNDPVLREHFLMRVLAHRRLRDLLDSDWRPADLIAFHSREKLLVLAHTDYRPLGRLIAHRGDMSLAEWGDAYRALYLRAIANPPSVGKHVNVLQHVAGYLRKCLDHASRTEVQNLIDAYQKRIVPLVVPITLLKHHIRSLGLGYLAAQSYLYGAPRRLMPQNYLVPASAC